MTLPLTTPVPTSGPRRPVLLLEINEVPWRLLDRFRDDPELPHLRAFLDGARTHTTLTTAAGELSPWVTWPTVHRGVPDTVHGVRFLGQDPATFGGAPVWDVVRARGGSVGVFGSLQSWPPRDPGPGGFFVPDPFAPDARCLPAWVEPFQAFNLAQTRSNPRVIEARSLHRWSSVAFALRAPLLGIRPRVVGEIALQLAAEQVDPRRLARRPVFQGILAWEIFRRLYDPRRAPALATFFTNQVAGLLHRYWRHVFPEDFGGTALATGPHLDTVRFALRSVDAMVADALRFQAQRPELVVMLASSMGQGPVRRERHGGLELSVERLEDLLAVCGLQPGDAVRLPAMVPQVSARFADPRRRALALERLAAVTTASGARLFSVREAGDRVSLTLEHPGRAAIEVGTLRAHGRAWTWAEAGVQVHAVEPSSGDHVPDGVLAVHGRGIAASDARETMPATSVKPMILELTGLA